MLRNTKILLNKFLVTLGFLVLCGLSACQQTEKAPIDSDKMKSILMDIHLAEAYSSMIVVDSVQKRVFNKNTDSLAVFYQTIFKQHQINLVQFEAAIQWYALHPDALDTAYTKMLPTLDSLKALPIKPFKN
jgi:ferric iron reductase protein FhuF